MAQRRTAGKVRSRPQLSIAMTILLFGPIGSCRGVSNSEVADDADDSPSSSGSRKDATERTTGGTSASESRKSGLTNRADNAQIGGSTSGTQWHSSERVGGAPTQPSSSAEEERRASSPNSGAGASTSVGDDAERSACPTTSSNWTEAVRFVLKATWEANSAGLAGSADIEVLMLVKLTANGTTLVGTTRGCRTTIPPAQLNAAGQLVTGGNKILTDIPDSVWDAPSMKTADCKGTQSGAGPADNVEYGFSSLIGLTINDPNGPWPTSAAGLATEDVDGDGNPGFTSTPKSGGGYVLPPTGLGILGSAPTADKVYIVSRNIIKLSGTRTACSEHSGKAVVSAFDNHVVGCHTKNGNCTSSQVDFCDQNRPIYKVGSATYEARRVPDTATCSDVRAQFSN